MDWYEIKFPQETSPFSEPATLEKEAQEIYEQSGFPEDFSVYMEINDS